eukprot:8587319-Alexandrium_andersonii.AAC.1
MSASLVGSEMCIRDREAPPFARRLLRMDLRNRGLRLSPIRSRGEGCLACLLYTSDAADDM